MNFENYLNTHVGSIKSKFNSLVLLGKFLKFLNFCRFLFQIFCFGDFFYFFFWNFIIFSITQIISSMKLWDWLRKLETRCHWRASASIALRINASKFQWRSGVCFADKFLIFKIISGSPKFLKNFFRVRDLWSGFLS